METPEHPDCSMYVPISDEVLRILADLHPANWSSDDADRLIETAHEANRLRRENERLRRDAEDLRAVCPPGLSEIVPVSEIAMLRAKANLCDETALSRRRDVEKTLSQGVVVRDAWLTRYDALTKEARDAE